MGIFSLGPVVENVVEYERTRRNDRGGGDVNVILLGKIFLKGLVYLTVKGAVISCIYGSYFNVIGILKGAVSCPKRAFDGIR